MATCANQGAFSDRPTPHTRCNDLQPLATSASPASSRRIELLRSGDAEGARWTALKTAESPFGYASFYYADELAALPVRAITRIKDNKSDPNLETGTYGLFSTCEERMRAGVVKRGASYLFFFARPRGATERCLTGMYELAAWTPGALGVRAGDYALAARALRFIAPIPISSLPIELAETLGTGWRLVKQLSPTQTHKLKALVNSKPDLSGAYLAEVDRLERLNKFHSGYCYPTWRRQKPWSWADAAAYLKPASKKGATQRISNSSPTGWWGCEACDAAIESGARLKACPNCQRLGSLRPLDAAEVEQIERSD